MRVYKIDLKTLQIDYTLYTGGAPELAIPLVANPDCAKNKRNI